MKRYKLLITATAAAFLFAGCLSPSVNPYYTAQDVTFDAGLLGSWQEQGQSGGSDIWTFAKSGEQAYQLTIQDAPGQTGQFAAHLFALKGQRFLDLIPTKCNFAKNQSALVGFAMFPGHVLVHVLQTKPELKLALYDPDWLKQYLQEHPEALAHHVESDTLLLTANTPDLQHFVLAHLDKLFGKPGVLVHTTKGGGE